MASFNSVDELYRSLIDESQEEKNLEMEESILETLFRDQKYDLILYALEKGFTLTPHIINYIKISGDLRLYQYIFHTLKDTSDLIGFAAASGKLETVKWLRENGCPWTIFTCYRAATHGHLEILKWLRENGYPWSNWTCTGVAALNGHLEVLKWCRENGCSWDVCICDNAAAGGHLEVLKWLRETGCPWSTFTCINAAAEGHLSVLKWARENGCPWDKDRCLREAKNYPEIVEWIKSN